jgi:membrane associated rhomboid family serine protease
VNELESDRAFSEARRPPFVTYLLCALCGLVFLLQLTQGAHDHAGIGYPGYEDGLALFSGSYWGLLTSFFLHSGITHVAFNVYWLYHFGRGVESRLGWMRYLLFWLAATCVSGLMEVIVTGDTGVGASGFGYALFGFVWVGSRRDPDLARLLDQQTVILFVVWLFVCMGLTWTGTAAIANGAHVGGMLFGALCAYAFLLTDGPLWKIVTAAMTVLFFVPLFYAPWLSTWNLAQAGRAYRHARYEDVLTYLDRVRLPEDYTYEMELRADSLSNLKRTREATADYKTLLEQSAESPSDPGYVYNEYAWILATSPDDQVRNAPDAIHYAQKACAVDQYRDPDSLDTLATAYASAHQFDQAVNWEQKAIAVETDSPALAELKAHLKLFQSEKPYRESPDSSDARGGS